MNGANQNAVPSCCTCKFSLILYRLQSSIVLFNFTRKTQTDGVVIVIICQTPTAKSVIWYNSVAVTLKRTCVSQVWWDVKNLLVFHRSDETLKTCLCVTGLMILGEVCLLAEPTVYSLRLTLPSNVPQSQQLLVDSVLPVCCQLMKHRHEYNWMTNNNRRHLSIKLISHNVSFLFALMQFWLKHIALELISSLRIAYVMTCNSSTPKFLASGLKTTTLLNTRPLIWHNLLCS